MQWIKWRIPNTYCTLKVQFLFAEYPGAFQPRSNLFAAYSTAESISSFKNKKKKVFFVPIDQLVAHLSRFHFLFISFWDFWTLHSLSFFQNYSKNGGSWKCKGADLVHHALWLCFISLIILYRILKGSFSANWLQSWF